MTIRAEIAFSCYNAITGEELKVDSIYINDSEISNSQFTCSYENKKYNYLIGKRGSSSRICRIKRQQPFSLKLTKDKFIDFRKDNISLKNYDGEFSGENWTKIINLGELPLVPEGKELVFGLSWKGESGDEGEIMRDLDSHLYVFDKDDKRKLQSS
jgi:hypothetical protein